ncbi:DUF2147 domain-containing protein [Hyphomicrobium sp. 99]|uniref:DUF2147 domain-containing protein n=1 Tax=Hyphomicrobium sp. 99 TaxID=1163419 RepID=UPI0005F7EB7B|nr:DUF2147 domain-containing protein [Hyphomicrobium sp. 99]
MRRVKYIASAFVALLAPAVLQSASAAGDPTGIWINDTGRGAVEIKQCGNALCGNVVWVKSESDAGGCGKQIIGDVAPAGDGRWDNGWIYSPERGRKYDVELTPLANGDLKVVGYAGIKFLSKTMIWKPAPQDLQLCGQSDAKVDAPAAKKPDAVTAALVAPPQPAASKPASSSIPPAATKDANTEPASQAPAADAQAPAADTKVDEKKADEAKTPAPASPASTDAAKNDNNANEGKAEGNDIAGQLGKIKIGDLQLDKVLTRTKSGKCKLDLPWVKVTIDCEQ